MFDKVGGGLLVLGAPGAGKTTVLLELARELLDRAEHDPDQPLPVVVNLASWAQQRRPLGEWLADELAAGYTVPTRLARAWIDSDALVLLLDGLDEVTDAYRAECVAALNAWRGEHGLVPLAVCSRTAEYQAIQAGLRVEAAVELRPPSDAQVDTYLGYLEATGTPLAEVRAMLTNDRELRELLRSPLLLHVVVLAYHGRPAPALAEPGSVAIREARLWEAYVARMFEQRPLAPDCGYTPGQARAWLAWLAGALRDRDQTEFYLDRLRLDWLTTPAQRRGVRWATGTLCGLLVGLAVGLLFWPVGRWAAGLLFGLLFGLPFGLTIGLARDWRSGEDGLAGDWRPSEEVRWSLRKLRENWVLALTLGLSLGLATGLGYGLAASLVGELASGLRTGLRIGPLIGLVVVLAAGLTDELRDERVMPNEGIRRSARNAVVVGVAAGTVAGLLFGLALEPVAAAIGGFLGLGFGLVFGGTAFVQHYLIRAAMASQRCAPWRYGQFLEAMTNRLLLRRAGSAYVFVHRLLRDYLAESSQAVRPCDRRPNQRRSGP